MSLIFKRIARNHAKAGFFPTDQATVEASLERLAPSEEARSVRLFDPCCGAGDAVADIARHLERFDALDVNTCGIEYDAQRATQAKAQLDLCLQADINDCVIGARQFSLLWLNPPYGDRLSDKSAVTVTPASTGRERLEKLFYQRTFPSLVFGGVIIFIIPGYALDQEMSRWLTTHFHHLSVYRAAEQTFKQVVIFGVRKPTQVSGAGSTAWRERLLAVASGDVEPPCITHRDEHRYALPEANAGGKLHTVKLDAPQLAEHLCYADALWPKFRHLFSTTGSRIKPPLCSLSDWHVALALAAGNLNGLVQSPAGRQLLVKGDTYKVKQHSVETQVDDKGHVCERHIAKDTFVPSIVGLDFTAGADSFGNVVHIR